MAIHNSIDLMMKPTHTSFATKSYHCAVEHDIRAHSRTALSDTHLQKALKQLQQGFIVKRRKAADAFPNFEACRDYARDIKDHCLKHLDLYLKHYEEQVITSGGKVHWARNGAEACEVILDICKQQNAKLVTKSKSMISEEVHLNDALEKAGLKVVETDLGEYIIQLRKERPSHIIAPAVHVLKEQVAEDFKKHHRSLPKKRNLDKRTDLIKEARVILRQQFKTADVGITGANFLIAENGASVIVTNEGNGDLTQTLAKTHIVIASLEKIVPTMEDAFVLLRVLARSATGQAMSSYTSFSTGPKRPDDDDGPQHYHVILLDNGRSDLLGGEFQDILRCIRCGACMNHCPVYHAVGGHAYGSVYPGPIGSVLTPIFDGLPKSRTLPHSSTLCGRCEAVCPVRIPLPRMLRAHRRLDFEHKLTPALQRWALFCWANIAKRPYLYRAITHISAKFLKWKSSNQGVIASLPFAKGWCAARDLPTPLGYSFHHWWKHHKDET